MYLLELAQKGIKVARAKMLAAEVLIKRDLLWRRHRLITLCSRAANQITQVYAARTLPLLQADHPLAGLYMNRAHENGHERAIPTLHRSRKEVLIIGEFALAETMRSKCTECRVKEKRAQSKEWALCLITGWGHANISISGNGFIWTH
jgi:hypothetical protein